MIASAFLLIILGILCLLGAIICVIFTIIYFANNKAHKYSWLIAFFICLIGLVTCIFLFVTKTIRRMESIVSAPFEQLYSDSLQRVSNKEAQVKLLRSFDETNLSIPHQFYSYLGFQNYYRFPLRYPYSIHCMDSCTIGDLYNEKNVQRFDINDNNEIQTDITNIYKIALDKNYLLVEQKISSRHSAEVKSHFILFYFETGKKEGADSEEELFKLAKEKGYSGSPVLITLEQYNSLF